MPIIPEVPLLEDRKTLAITGAGSAACRDIERMTSFLSFAGGFDQLLATIALSKNPAELRALKEAIEGHYRRYRSRFPTKGLGPEFVHLERRLTGPGKEFLKRVDLAVKHLPFYTRDVEAAVEWFSQILDEAGGVEILFQLLSSGGHIVAQMLFHYLLAQRINRPPLVVSSVIRPHRTDLAAHLIFTELMRMLLDEQGVDVLILRDNQSASLTRPVDEQDRIAGAAMMAPFSASWSKTRSPAVEIYDAFAKKGGLVGIWGKKLTFKVLQVGSYFRKRTVKDRDLTVEQALGAVQALLHEPQVGSQTPATSFTGFPAASDGQSVFAVIGNITRPTFEVVEQEVQQHGPCLFVPADFSNIYITRMANIDHRAVAQDLNIPEPAKSVSQNGHHDLEWALDVLAKRWETQAGTLRNPWQGEE
jgi:hypothetical protein